MNSCSLYFWEDEEYEALVLEILSIIFYFFTIGTGCSMKILVLNGLVWTLVMFNFVGFLDIINL